MAWAVLSRLQNEYLDSIQGREAIYVKTIEINDKIINSTSNEEIREAMKQISKIVDELNLNELPHLVYRNSNNI